MSNFHLVISFLCLTYFANAQAPGILIQIIDAQNGQNLPFATVKYEGGGGYTDSTGIFEMTLPGGEAQMELEIILVGYRTRIATIQRSADLQPIAMEPLSEAIGEVVVSGTLRAVSRAESPVPIEVYSPKFFKANPAPSLFDGLNIVNGVQPQLNCNVCATGDIHINGLEGPYTMILIDGMPIVSALSTVYGLQGIPLSLVERMEVVKGPASTLYGSEAVAGLINVITKDPFRAPKWTFDLNHTGLGETTVDAEASFRGRSIAGLFAVNAFNFQRRWDVNNDYFTDITLQKRASVFGKIAFNRGQNRVASIAARYVWEDRFGGQMNWSEAWYATDSIYGEAIRTNRAELIGNWQLPLKAPVFLSYSYNIHNQESVYGTTIYNGIQQVAFGQLYWAPVWKNHTALFGSALRFTSLDDNTPITAAAEGRNQPVQTWLPGFFAQDDIRLNGRHRLLLGLRFDWNSTHGAVWSPRANWKWAFTDRQTLRFSVGNGYRVANVFSEDHAALTGSRRVVLGEDLKPERSWNGNLNYVLQFFPAFGFVDIDASAFYTHFTNRILADYFTDPDAIIFDNLSGYSVSRGFTLNTAWNFMSGLRIRAGATWMEVFTEENGSRQPQVHAPPFSATWSASYTFPRWKITLDYTGSANSPMPLPVVPNDFRPGYSPWFSLQNLQISRPFGRAEVYVGVKNILNFLPRDPLLRPFDPFDKNADDPETNPNGYTFDTAYSYAPMMPRRWFVGVRFQ